MRSRPTVVATALVVLTFTASAAWAHAKLLRAAPAAGSVLIHPPAVVRLWFSDELDVRRSALSVWNARGQRIDNGRGGVDLADLDRKTMKAALKPMTSGRYRVRWRAVSADDLFVSSGSFAFVVRATPK
ncbi:MAG TPA: copper resistance CopC family protein [bacterium]